MNRSNSRSYKHLRDSLWVKMCFVGMRLQAQLAANTMLDSICNESDKTMLHHRWCSLGSLNAVMSLGDRIVK